MSKEEHQIPNFQSLELIFSRHYNLKAMYGGKGGFFFVSLIVSKLHSGKSMKGRKFCRLQLPRSL